MTRHNVTLRDGRRGSALFVFVTPRSKRTEIVGLREDDTLHIRLAAPPIAGKANRELIRFLAEFLAVPPSQIEIVAGASGRKKLVSILGLDPDNVQEKLTQLRASSSQHP